jgi:hypothetical protein
MDIIDKPDSRRRKYYDKKILNILILIQIFNISHRLSGIFLINHMELIGIDEIPSFLALSRRSRCFNSHGAYMQAFNSRWEEEVQ